MSQNLRTSLRSSIPQKGHYTEMQESGQMFTISYSAEDISLPLRSDMYNCSLRTVLFPLISKLFGGRYCSSIDSETFELQRAKSFQSQDNGEANADSHRRLEEPTPDYPMVTFLTFQFIFSSLAFSRYL